MLETNVLLLNPTFQIGLFSRFKRILDCCHVGKRKCSPVLCQPYKLLCCTQT